MKKRGKKEAPAIVPAMAPKKKAPATKKTTSKKKIYSIIKSFLIKIIKKQKCL